MLVALEATFRLVSMASEQSPGWSVASALEVFAHVAHRVEAAGFEFSI